MTLNDSLLGVDMSAGQDQSLSHGNTTISISTGKNEVSLERQKLGHRKILFRFCLWVCISLYVLFAAAIGKAILSDDFFLTLLAHKHIAAFILALLIVPSALLWGMMRAAYMPEKEPVDAEELAKLFKGIHPGAG